MKVDVDYKTAHVAIEKFIKGEVLTKKEKDSITLILQTSIGDLIPTKEELGLQERNLDMLDSLKPGSDSWNNIMGKVDAFENKYC